MWVGFVQGSSCGLIGNGYCLVCLRGNRFVRWEEFMFMQRLQKGHLNKWH
mgnify:CR=1 FL=1